MNLLAIDTSNQVLGVALMKDDILVGEFVTNIKKNHSVRLMPAIDQLMRETDMTPDMLDKIAVAKGPGSFTGVRIGLATAKAMAWALDIPVTGVSSLEVLAYQGRFSNRLICPFFDARRANVYAGLFQWQGNQLQTVKQEQNVAMTDWLKPLAAAQQTVLFLSPDMALYREKVVEEMGELAVIPDGPYMIANPSHLALAGLQKGADNTHALTPNYLRLAEAEAKWLDAQKDQKTNG
ncbi:tRNA (adenosine(37)-N6)-threonylcarbamoyltransferase complex dimerization subunit type 1 TsaB [Lentibacillus sp. N15]|uniref:tRNA (adenosine(37)-N6)-threonylcarbamoyltransferase complex dimerization subunit type 1 TsaB n=1 Tax=Lentibacillus songyuanensis TaxID=3136161 RepID=UPI0031B9D67D